MASRDALSARGADARRAVHGDGHHRRHRGDAIGRRDKSQRGPVALFEASDEVGQSGVRVGREQHVGDLALQVDLPDDNGHVLSGPGIGNRDALRTRLQVDEQAVDRAEKVVALAVVMRQPGDFFEQQLLVGGELVGVIRPLDPGRALEIAEGMKPTPPFQERYV